MHGLGQCLLSAESSVSTGQKRPRRLRLRSRCRLYCGVTFTRSSTVIIHTCVHTYAIQTHAATAAPTYKDEYICYNGYLQNNSAFIFLSYCLLQGIRSCVLGCLVKVVNAVVLRVFKIHFTQMMGKLLLWGSFLWCKWSTLQCIE